MQAVADRGYETSQYATPKRTLHVVDIENLLGDPFFFGHGRSPGRLRRGISLQMSGEGDLMLVAASRWLYRQLAFAALAGHAASMGLRGVMAPTKNCLWKQTSQD